jgi:hypothetical protein
MWPFRRTQPSRQRYITEKEPLDWYLELLIERLDRIADLMESGKSE